MDEQNMRGSFEMSEQKIFTRDFTFCFLAQFAFSSVFFVLIPTLPIYLSKLGTREAEIGVLIGISSIFSLMLRPFIGKGLSKTPEKNFLFAGTFVLTLSMVTLIWISPFWPLLIVRAFQGVSAALFYTSSFTLIAHISPGARRGQSISIYYLSNNLAFALVPSLGMVLVNSLDFPINFTVLFLSCTGLCICSLILILKLGKKEGPPPEGPSLHKQPLLSRAAVPPAIMASLSNIIWGTMAAFFPLHAIHHGVTNPGIVFAVFAIMLILGRGFGGKFLDLYAKEREKVLFPCLTTYVMAMALLAFSKSLPMFILVAILWGLGNALFYPMLVTMALDGEDSDRGPAMGTFLAIADLGTGLGPVMMGLILNWTSYPVMFLCLSLVGVINFLYFQFSVRKKGGVSYANL
jgi:predicted MFS family arabinose efflux permease